MKKILIVDDQASWRIFNKKAVYELMGNNIDVQTASSAQEGYNLILENLIQPYDCILTDMQMEDDFEPKMAGEWLVEQVKNLVQYHNTKIIIISASIGAKHIAEYYGVECIPKSVAVNTLEAYKEVLLN